MFQEKTATLAEKLLQFIDGNKKDFKPLADHFMISCVIRAGHCPQVTPSRRVYQIFSTYAGKIFITTENQLLVVEEDTPNFEVTVRLYLDINVHTVQVLIEQFADMFNFEDKHEAFCTAIERVLLSQHDAPPVPGSAT